MFNSDTSHIQLLQEAASLLLELSDQLYAKKAPAFICHPEGMVLAANNAAEEITTTPAIGHAVSELLAGKFSFDFEKTVQKLSRKQQYKKLLEETNPESDSQFWWLKARLLRHENQPLVLLRFTPAKVNREEVLTKVKDYRSLFENSLEAIFIINRSGNLLELNNTASQVTGYAKEELKGKSVYKLFELKQTEKTVFKRLLNLALQNHPQKFVWWLRRKDQTQQPVEIMLRRELYHGQEVIIGSARDITEHLVTEQNIRSRNQQLEFINYLLTNLPHYKTAESMLQFTLDQLIEKSDFAGGGIYVYQATKKAAVLTSSSGQQSELFRQHERLTLSEEHITQLLQKGTRNNLHSVNARLQQELQYKNLVVMPVTGHNSYLALLVLLPKEKNLLTPSMHSLVAFIGNGISTYLTKYQLRQELSSSESKYKALYEGTNDAIFLSTDTEVIDCNDRAISMFGCPKQRLLGVISDFISPKYQPDGQLSTEKAKKLIRETLDTGLPKTFEWQNLRCSGELIDTEVTLTRVCFNEKHYIQIIVRDITQRKKAEGALRREEILRESVKHFRNFLEKVNLAFISLNLKGNIVYANDYFLNFSGYSREELMGKNYFEVFLSPEDREKRKADFDRSIRTRNLNSNYERDLITKSGHVKTLRWNSVFEIDPDGNIIGLSSVGKDMTDKRIAMEALKDNKIRLQDLFDNAHDLIQNISVDNKFIFVNKAWKDKLGYNDHDIEKLSLNDIVHPYYKAKLIYQLRNLYKGEKVNKIETVFLTKSGKPVHLIGSISCSWQNDKPIATRAILHDITDRIKAERLQKVYYSIANLAISSKDLDSLYSAIHRELSKIIETRNIYIALCNDRRTELNFVYFVDQYTQTGPRRNLIRPFSKGISEYIIKTGKPLYLLKNDFHHLIDKGKVSLHGTVPEVMLCSPLSVGDKIIGVIAVQDYTKPDAYINTDIEILHFISNQVALAIERKRNEEQINKQNARLKAIFESGSHMMWSVNRKSQLTSFNQNYVNTFRKRNGFDPEPGQVLNSRNLKFLGRSFYSYWRERYKEAFQGIAQHFELKIEEPDGSETWREIFLNPIYLEDGTFEEVSAIAHDITEKKLSQLALAQSEEKFRNIFESFQDLFYRTDQHGHIILISPSVHDILGFTQEEVLGQKSSEFYVYQEEREALINKLHEQDQVYNFEISLRCKDGTIKQLLLNSRMLYDEEGRKNGVEGVGRDITELKQTQLELIRAKEMAENLLQVKTQFLANMSHELRTPMNGIIGMIDLLYHTINTEEQREYVETLRKSSEALLTILNDILDLSKIQAGKLSISEAAVDLHDTLSKIHSLFANRALQKKLEFRYVISPDTPRFIITDEIRLLQILSNLTSNAIKFTNKGAVTINVKTVQRGSKKCLLEFQVTDSGIGITEEDKELLFTNFTQLDNSSTKTFGGTGLGLAISKQLAELLGGEIGVESEYGKGSTFWFTIRCRIANEQDIVRELEATQAPEQDMEQFEQAPYILLVDDNLINQKVATKLLEKIGCVTDIASNGFEAIDLALKHRYNIIFMDIQMPEMDGVTAMLEIRKKLGENCPPIIAMTAYSMENDAEKFIAQGMDDYISKPVKSGDLYDMIRKWEKSKKYFAPEPEEKAPAEPEQNIIDLRIVEQLREIGGPEFAEQLYKDFEKEAGELLDESKKEVTAKHYKGILSKLHQIKGTGFTLGLNPLAETARQLEHDILIDQTENVDQTFGKLLEYYDQYKNLYLNIITQN